nr:MAG TPA: hypothetical protein [Caudoviricetes sp.]
MNFAASLRAREVSAIGNFLAYVRTCARKARPFGRPQTSVKSESCV